MYFKKKLINYLQIVVKILRKLNFQMSFGYTIDKNDEFYFLKKKIKYTIVKLFCKKNFFNIKKNSQ